MEKNRSTGGLSKPNSFSSWAMNSGGRPRAPSYPASPPSCSALSAVALLVGPVLGAPINWFTLYLGAAVVVEVIALTPLLKRPIVFGALSGFMASLFVHPGKTNDDTAEWRRQQSEQQAQLLEELKALRAEVKALQQK